MSKDKKLMQTKNEILQSWGKHKNNVFVAPSVYTPYENLIKI